MRGNGGFILTIGGGRFRRLCGLLLTEGLAVGALVHGGIGLVGAHQDADQRAVVLGVAVISAGLDGTLNTLVCVAVHIHFLLLLDYGLIMRFLRKSIHTVAIWQKI